MVVPWLPIGNQSSARVSTANATPLKRGVARGGSGSAFSLPKLANIQWEKRTDRPGFTCWHAPHGASAPRQTKTYLGYASKKLLAEWAVLQADHQRAVVEQWVSERRAEKGSG